MTRPVDSVITAQRQMEGGGFPVRRPFPTATLDRIDPFLLLDEMGPVEWAPGEAIGAPDHPHRGFETVTYLLAGHMCHRDSWGNVGELRAGDVQWMTAGSGLVHSEMPHPDFAARGGTIHGFQLWVNLPRASKMMAPRYQEIAAAGAPRTEQRFEVAPAVRRQRLELHRRPSVGAVISVVPPQPQKRHPVAEPCNRCFARFRSTC